MIVSCWFGSVRRVGLGWVELSWYGMVWLGFVVLVWLGSVWLGFVRFGLVCCGRVWFCWILAVVMFRFVISVAVVETLFASGEVCCVLYFSPVVLLSVTTVVLPS